MRKSLSPVALLALAGASFVMSLPYWSRSAPPTTFSAPPPQCRAAAIEQLMKLKPDSPLVRKLAGIMARTNGSLQALTEAANAALRPQVPIELTFYRESGEAGFIVSPNELARQVAAAVETPFPGGVAVPSLDWTDQCQLRVRSVERLDTAALAKLETHVRGLTGLPLGVTSATSDGFEAVVDGSATVQAVVDAIRKQADVAYAHPNQIIELTPKPR
jgi:hypothetical protein